MLIGRQLPKPTLQVGENASARNQLGQLACLGCQVDIVKDCDELALAIQDASHRVLPLDAASFDALGPELVRKVNAASPSMAEEIGRAAIRSRILTVVSALYTMSPRAACRISSA